MQGRKEITPKIMYQVHIGELVPQDNGKEKTGGTTLRLETTHT